MNEFLWVDHLRKSALSSKKLIRGIGDDCAIVREGSHFLLFTSDLFIENTHFKMNSMSLSTIAKRAVGRSLSDIAACGGVPKYVGISVGMGTVGARGLKQLARGIRSMAKQYKFSLMGGDTSRSRQFFMDVWAVGEAKKYITRSGAQVGDYIFLTSRLGELPFHRVFRPAIREGVYVTRHHKVNAMIDISDGFILDLYRILRESNKGATIFKESIPFKKESDLYRGEDYGLIFTVSKHEKKLATLMKKFYLVGRVEAKKNGFKIEEAGKVRNVRVKGYLHLP